MFFQAKTKGDTFWKECEGAVPAADVYWSSTQFNRGLAWGVYFSGVGAGSVYVDGTSDPLGVRAVRAF